MEVVSNIAFYSQHNSQYKIIVLYSTIHSCFHSLTKGRSLREQSLIGKESRARFRGRVTDIQRQMWNSQNIFKRQFRIIENSEFWTLTNKNLTNFFRNQRRMRRLWQLKIWLVLTSLDIHFNCLFYSIQFYHHILFSPFTKEALHQCIEWSGKIYPFFSAQSHNRMIKIIFQSLSMAKKGLQSQISQATERLRSIFSQYESLMQQKDNLRSWPAEIPPFSRENCIEGTNTNIEASRADKLVNKEKIIKMHETMASIQNFFQSCMQVFQKHEKCNALNQQKDGKIKELEQYIEELSGKFSLSKNQLNHALERLTITNQILQQSQTAYEKKLASILERNRHLTEEIEFLERNIEKMHQSERLERNETESMRLQNGLLKKKIERFEKILNGEISLVENPEKQIACSQVIERMKSSDLREKTRPPCQNDEIKYDELTRQEETIRSSPLKKKKSILINNSIAQKIVYSRTRPRSVQQAIRKSSGGYDKKQNSSKFGFLSYLAQTMKGHQNV